MRLISIGGLLQLTWLLLDENDLYLKLLTKHFNTNSRMPISSRDIRIINARMVTFKIGIELPGENGRKKKKKKKNIYIYSVTFTLFDVNTPYNCIHTFKFS